VAHREPDADDRKGGKRDYDKDDPRVTGGAKAKARAAMSKYDAGMHSGGAGGMSMHQLADKLHPVKRR